MDEKGGRFRKKKVNFSMVSNCIIRDADISLKAKGLYALIQSYITIENFTLYKGFLQSKCREGKKAFESAWQELKKSGYLVQYRMQDEETKQFYWEYELLDEIEPLPQKGGYGNQKQLPQKGCDGSRGVMQADIMENGGDKSNTSFTNTEENKTNQIISNQIISSADVMEQIGYEAFSNADLPQVDEIVMLMCDVLNTPDDNTIRIAKLDKPSSLVKARFTRIDHFNVEYVLECLQKSTGKISNMRSYLLTALYNAPSTMQSYYQNQVNHDLYGT